MESIRASVIYRCFKLIKASLLFCHPLELLQLICFIYFLLIKTKDLLGDQCSSTNTSSLFPLRDLVFCSDFLSIFLITS